MKLICSHKQEKASSETTSAIIIVYVTHYDYVYFEVLNIVRKRS